jgi:4-amino-4-deoxy-L-arabinose transferase
MRSGPRKALSFVRNNEEILFMILWIMIPLVIFSISRSRLELYVLPLYAPIALLIARWISGYESTAWKRLVTVAVVSVVVFAGFKFGIASFPNRNNMQQVYRLGLEAGNRNAEYFVFEEDKLYGMQFYLNGTMQRVTSTGRELWADIGVEDLLSTLQGEKISKKYLVLSSRKKAPFIEDILSDSGFDVQKTENKYWVWYKISQKAQ